MPTSAFLCVLCLSLKNGRSSIAFWEVGVVLLGCPWGVVRYVFFLIEMVVSSYVVCGLEELMMLSADLLYIVWPVVVGVYHALRHRFVLEISCTTLTVEWVVHSPRIGCSPSVAVYLGIWLFLVLVWCSV